MSGKNGLAGGHAYVMTAAAKIQYEGKPTRLVRIRNPWGRKNKGNDSLIGLQINKQGTGTGYTRMKKKLRIYENLRSGRSGRHIDHTCIPLLGSVLTHEP